jgi:hypothetical protein
MSAGRAKVSRSPIGAAEPRAENPDPMGIADSLLLSSYEILTQAGTSSDRGAYPADTF